MLEKVPEKVKFLNTKLIAKWTNYWINFNYTNLETDFSTHHQVYLPTIPSQKYT